jgi:hypothetical protein
MYVLKNLFWSAAVGPLSPLTILVNLVGLELSFAVGYLQVNSMLKVCSLDYLHVRYNAIGRNFDLTCCTK